MAQTSVLKSVSITNMDATPVVRPYTGKGSAGNLRHVSDYVTALSADAAASTYRLVRFPTTAKVKTLHICSAIASAGSFDISLYFSDSTNDGTQPALSGLAIGIPSTANKLFGAAISLVGTGQRVDTTYLGTYTPPMQNITMWQNLVTLGCTQFTTDPGGYFDVVAVCTTAVTTGGIVGCEVTYVE